jgi:hypothetical protein
MPQPSPTAPFKPVYKGSRSIRAAIECVLLCFWEEGVEVASDFVVTSGLILMEPLRLKARAAGSISGMVISGEFDGGSGVRDVGGPETSTQARGYRV